MARPPKGPPGSRFLVIPMFLIIENLEKHLSEWLWLEYKHSSDIVEKNVLFTNVREGFERLREIGWISTLSVTDISPGGIILDPIARDPLTPEDFEFSEILIVGGILGSQIPRGRTYSLITKKLLKKHEENYLVRNIGEYQFTIDGSVLVAKLVELGLELEEIEVAYGVEVESNGESHFLPYAYPMIDGKVLITPGLVEYLFSTQRDEEE